MHPSWIFSLPPEVSLEVDADAGLVFQSDWGRFTQPAHEPAVCAALSRLAKSRRRLGSMIAEVERRGEPGDVARLLYLLRQLARRSLLWLSAGDEEQPLATLLSTGSAFSLTEAPIDEGTFALSRFACVRRFFDAAVLESPLSSARLVLHDERAMRLLFRLAAGNLAAAEIVEGTCGLEPDAAAPLFQLLAAAGLLTEVGDNGETAEDDHPSLRFWEFHDLLFHTSSREGRHDGPVGAAFPWAGEIAPPPALPVERGDSTRAIALFRPDLTQLAEHDPPFSQVMEERSSIRDYGTDPITAEQLGEFLYRVGRVTKQFDHQFDFPGGSVTMDFAARPYPSAGAVYELEIYPLIQSCSGIDAGLYHYNALEHRLTPIAAEESHCGELLSGGADAAGIAPETLQVQLILSARFARMSWKYMGMAYAAILKNVGVLYQTMYLTAAAMDLAPCALGSGDSDLFARAIGGDYYAETSVGEFLLSSRGESPA